MGYGKEFIRMKKNVVKAMSVGLSAITIASSLSVPVLADELDTSASDAQQKMLER